MAFAQQTVAPEHCDDIYRQLSLLQKNQAKLQRLVIFLVSGIVLASSLLLVSFNNKPPAIVNTFENNVLKVRGLVVVDSNGIERVWVGAPAPDPLMYGKRINRGGGFSGILMFDKTGIERSGYGTFDEGNAVGITLDEAGRMVANFSARDAGGVKLMILDEYDNQLNIGTYNKGPYIRMLKRGGSSGDKLLMIKADSVQGLNLIK